MRDIIAHGEQIPGIRFPKSRFGSDEDYYYELWSGLVNGDFELDIHITPHDRKLLKYLPLNIPDLVLQSDAFTNLLCAVVAQRLEDRFAFQDKPRLILKLPAYVLLTKYQIISLHTFLQQSGEGLIRMIKTIDMILKSGLITAQVDQFQLMSLRWFLWQMLK